MPFGFPALGSWAEPLDILADHPINSSFIGCKLLAFDLSFAKEAVIAILATFNFSISLHPSLQPKRNALQQEKTRLAYFALVNLGPAACPNRLALRQVRARRVKSRRSHSNSREQSIDQGPARTRLAIISRLDHQNFEKSITGSLGKSASFF